MARGDRLRVKRRLSGLPICYGHHGIDVGDGTVVHARPDDARRLFAGGRVVRTTLEEFAAGEDVEIVPDPPASFLPDEIVARAMQQVGRDGYCPVIDNCEHFATWCATGERRSRQIDALVTGIGRVAAMVAVAVMARSALNPGRGGGALAAVTRRSR